MERDFRMITKGLVRLMLGVITLSTLLAAQKPGPKPAGAADRLHKLFDAEWEYTMRESPEWASQLGDKRYNDRWSDASLANIKKRHQHSLEVAQQLAAIPRTGLSQTDQINYDMFKRDLDDEAG